MTETMGGKIRTLRKKKGLTLAGLAERAGSSKSYVWELENRDPPRPSGEKIAALAAALGVTADYLLDEGGQLSEANAEDEAFYREYSNLPPETKEKLRAMLKLLDGDA